MSSWNIPNSDCWDPQKKSGLLQKEEISLGNIGQSVMSIWPDWKFVNMLLKSEYTVKIRVELEGPKGDQVVAPDWFTACARGILPSNSNGLVFRKRRRIRTERTERNLNSKSLRMDRTFKI
jgi:hypothetical protein